MKVAVAGAGWAGLAAAVTAVQAGHEVTVFEAARIPGGRARSVAAAMPDGGDLLLDNGQHILIGAYTQTLSLMRAVGVDTDAALLRLPLTLLFPDGQGLHLPGWPAPLDALAGILGARGWSWRDKLSLLAAATGWQLRRFECNAQLSVAQLCATIAPRVIRELVEPLCVSALNTPAARSSARVFLRVIRDSLFGVRGGSNLLLPRVALGALFPQAASAWLAQRGGRVVTGHRVQAIAREAAAWQVDGEPFDRVLLACAPWDAARLVQQGGVDAPEWLRRTQALEFEAITTVYASGTRALPQPMLALRAGDGAPAQFVFDRGRLGGPAGLLAFVVSASHGDRELLQSQVIAQGEALGFGPLTAVQTVVEKRATFACTPGLQRPAMRIAPDLFACGDYVEGPYPATLEGAVRCGIAAARAAGDPA